MDETPSRADLTQAQRVGLARGRSVAELLFTVGDDRGQAVVLALRGAYTAALGPFPSKAAAQRYGRKYHPRHHVVVGLHNPEGV